MNSKHYPLKRDADLNFDNVIFVKTNKTTSVSLFLMVVTTACTLILLLLL